MVLIMWQVLNHDSEVFISHNYQLLFVFSLLGRRENPHVSPSPDLREEGGRVGRPVS